ncbi:uncharacterized protein I206_107700 [Kwoniella pini CBS 10737]|uniref:rRNA biogenesis protein RRP36 n=1 Tax=Kwoniella pini CBS 10737 TaxID=1296096 RepID=A0A1B9HY12_9TREE|nr:uncharacterized protein I206_06034 [Kwoniella pini CBS 10737]OCF48166.1 hypothetical protein I206_06034 [Kwoniella pini CBS 10737]
MAKGSSSKLQQKTRLPHPPVEVEDDYLEDDSEVDEFADDYDSPPEGEGEDDGQSVDQQTDEEEGTARWEADDWNENDETDSEDSQSGSSSGSEDEEDMQLKKLQNDLTSLPLSTLAKAQKTLASPKQRSSSSSSSTSSTKEERVAAIKAKLAQLQKGKGKAITVDPYSQSSARNGTASEDENSSDEDSGPEMGSTKRGSKHAPVALSTKKQVSRNRQVVDIHRPDRRDPRFSSVSAGNLDAHLHNASYNFLPSMLKEEMKNLKISLKEAIKIENNCPLFEKSLRILEREKIELNLSKIRTKLVKYENEERERNVLSKINKEERIKRKQGKGSWFMKKSEKKDLLLKSKFESLEQKGGKSAVKKVLEKKRKKLASKEKKSRPFAKGSNSNPNGGGNGGGGGEGGQRKRQRV